jgi:hypothetical protein
MPTVRNVLSSCLTGAGSADDLSFHDLRPTIFPLCSTTLDLVENILIQTSTREGLRTSSIACSPNWRSEQPERVVTGLVVESATANEGVGVRIPPTTEHFVRTTTFITTFRLRGVRQDVVSTSVLGKDGLRAVELLHGQTLSSSSHVRQS